jgi:hypothetical protein
VQVIGQQSAKHRPEDAGAHEGHRDVALGRTWPKLLAGLRKSRAALA